MLCQTQVMIDGAELDHHFFSDIQDVTLGLMLDGFQIFKAQRDGGATCWPLIALNFNLLTSTCGLCISSLSASYLGQKPQKTSTYSFLKMNSINFPQVDGLSTHIIIKHSRYISTLSTFT